MYRIDDTTASPTLPALPTDNIGAAGYFTGGNPSASPPVPATRVRFWWLNLVQESLMALLTAAGLTPSKSDSTLVLQAVMKLPQGRLLNVQTFTASGTYTPTAGARLVRARMQGGGGAGAGATIPSSGLVTVGTSGASGAYAEALILVSTIGASQAVTVGAAGAKVVGASGGAGGTSSLGALMTTPGGPGGIMSPSISAPVVAANGTPSAAASFGSGVTSIVSTYGASENLSVGMTGGNGTGAAGGRSQFGLGGLPTNINAPGSAAPNRGAGGGGVYCGSGLSSAVAGGDGAAGIVIIEEYS